MQAVNRFSSQERFLFAIAMIFHSSRKKRKRKTVERTFFLQDGTWACKNRSTFDLRGNLLVKWLVFIDILSQHWHWGKNLYKWGNKGILLKLKENTFHERSSTTSISSFATMRNKSCVLKLLTTIVFLVKIYCFHVRHSCIGFRSRF